ncbi:MAG TPA: recombinase family protein, partial [Candidatus Poseidoniaceae archaeon]|nr:recombinase family protein [Candidatus Poseidoniaceae archaeon]
MSGPLEQLIEPSETTAEPSVDSVSTRVWTTPSNASANSNSKESRISNVFGNNKKNKSRAVAYARVPSKRQAEEGVSLAAQVERLIAYAEFRGLELDPEDIYIDDGISAAIHLWSRPAGRKMR